jgi:hypothetical protein
LRNSDGGIPAFLTIRPILTIKLASRPPNADPKQPFPGSVGNIHLYQTYSQLANRSGRSLFTSKSMERPQFIRDRLMGYSRRIVTWRRHFAGARLKSHARRGGGEWGADAPRWATHLAVRIALETD